MVVGLPGAVGWPPRGQEGHSLSRQFFVPDWQFLGTGWTFLIRPDYPDPLIYDPYAWLLTQGRSAQTCRPPSVLAR